MKIQKKGIAVLLGFALFLSCLYYNPAGIYADGETTAKGKIELQQGNSTGTVLNLQVRIYGMESFAGLEGNLSYDRAVLDVVTGSAITVAPYKQENTVPGSVNFKAALTQSAGAGADVLKVESQSGNLTADDLKAAQGDGLVVTIPFAVKANSTAARTVSLLDVKIYTDADRSEENAFSVGNTDISPLTIGMGMVLGTEDVSGSGLVRVPLSIKEVSTGVKIDQFAVSVTYDPKILKFSYDSSLPGKDAASQLNNRISVREHSDSNSNGKVTMVFLVSPTPLEGQDKGEFIQLAFRPVNEVAATLETTVKITLTEAHLVVGSANVQLDNTTLVSNVTLTPLSFKLGDVNEDGKITLLDALFVLKEIQNRDAITGTDSLKEDQKKAADVDQDGYVTLLDVTWIMEYYNGVRKSFAEIK